MNTGNFLIKVLVCSTALALLFAGFFVWLVVIQRRKQNEHYYEKLRILFEAKQKEINARIEEREIMMNQMSNDVHDNILQIANAIRMHFHKIEQLATDMDQLSSIKIASKFTDELILSAHYVSYSLNGEHIKERGLFRIICDQVEQIKTTRKIDNDIEITDDGTPIHPEQALIICRIAQETLNNISKHADATMITVRLTHYGNYFKMVIGDDGIGISENDYKKGRLGISNMRQRATILSGEFSIQSEPGEGCSVMLIVNKLQPC